MKGRQVVLAAALSALAVVASSSFAGAASTDVAQSNAAGFTYPAAVAESATVYTRAPRAGVVVTLSAVPRGRAAVVTAVVANRGASAVRFPAGGVRVMARVLRDGGLAGTWVLRSGTASLAPGARVTITRSFTIPRKGTYELTGFVRYSG